MRRASPQRCLDLSAGDAAVTDFFDLGNRTMRALEMAREADEHQQAADETHGTPEAARDAHWDAVSHLRTVTERLSVLMEAHKFQARRMDYEQKRELRTGIEFKAGGDAA